MKQPEKTPSLHGEGSRGSERGWPLLRPWMAQVDVRQGPQKISTTQPTNHLKANLVPEMARVSFSVWPTEAIQPGVVAHTPVLPALRKLKQEVWASLGYMVRTRRKTSPAENLTVKTRLPMMIKGISERRGVKGKMVTSPTGASMTWGPKKGV